MKKKVLLFLALLCMVAQGAWAASGSWSDEENRDLTWGSNYESASSFTISTAAQLAQLAYMVNNGKNFSGKTVTLGADIDLSAHYWVPIGCERSSYNTFNGTFDGALHTIRGMETTFTTESYDSNSNANVYGYHMGLFGDIWDSTKATVIKRVKLAKSTITGREYVGGIVGRNEGATIEGCHVAEDVKIIVTVTKADRIGGIAGVNSTGVIKYCSSKVVIDANENSELSFCGGIVGDNGSEIYYCLFVGDQIDGTEYVGGIAGRSSGNDVKLEHNIYYTNNSNLKGINGEDSENIYPAKKVTFGDDGFSIKEDFDYTGFMKWVSAGIYHYVIVLDDIIYSRTGMAFSITHTLPEVGYDYDLVLSDNTAEFDDYRGFTWVKIGNDDLTITFETSKAFDGEGTEESPFLIQSMADIKKLSKISNGILPITFEGCYFKLTTDLTFNGTENEFVPISYIQNEDGDSFKRYFSGHFDGDGHVISGLNLKFLTDEIYRVEALGFFGKIKNGSVKNLVIKNSTLVCYHNTGAIVGEMETGLIENCHVGSDVTILKSEKGYPERVGGIVGKASGTIKGCTCAATIEFPDKARAAYSVGGIVGLFQSTSSTSSTMQDCLYYGDATAFNYFDTPGEFHNIGTLAGDAYQNPVFLCNLYDKNKANVSAIGDYNKDSDYDQEGACGAYIVNISQPVYLGNTLDILKVNNVATTTYPTFENFPSLTVFDGFMSLDGTYYAKANAEIAMTTGDKYRATLSVADAVISDNGFTMPEADVTVTATDIARKEWGGSGTEAAPYTIANVAAMNALAEEVNGSAAATYCFAQQYFKMTADIDYSNEAIDKDNGKSNYAPVGYWKNDESQSRRFFSGIFDGDGHTLSGLMINTPTENRITQGVFGMIGDDNNTATVKNLKLANSTIVAIDNTYVGGIVSYLLNDALVDNCEVASNVRFGIHSGDNPDKVAIGGIVGVASTQYAKISNCFSEGNFDLGKEARAYNTGAIVGLYNNESKFTKNYYRISNAEVKGVGAADKFTGTDVDGANAALTLTFNEVDGGTSSTDTEATITHNGTGYFIAGNAVNLKYEGDYTDNGYTFSTDSEGSTVSGKTLTVGTEDVEINTAINISLSNTEKNDEVLNAMKHSVNVTLEGRTLQKDGTWNTLCLPFDVEIAGSPLDGATVKTLSSSSFSNGTLTLNFTDANSIEAGKPYIVKWDEAWFSSNSIQNPTFSNTTISATEAQAIETASTDFVGTFSPVTLEANDKSVLFLGANNKLYWPSADVPVNSCRAYFKLNGLTAGEITNGAIELNFDGETTGISRPTPDPSLNGGEWYDLQGHKLNGKPTNSGIYVNNGKKIVIK
ncbi:MAG: hypothetical protein IJP46_09315 [Prevotella sp.]|nr:hypothetical protein [Prevotella sp.]